MKEKIYSVSQSNLPYFEKVCMRDDIEYKILSPNKKGVDVLIKDISDRKFKVILEDSICERERKKNKNDIPVYSLRTIKNKEKIKRLMKINQKSCFHVLSKDIDKYEMYA